MRKIGKPGEDSLRQSELKKRGEQKGRLIHVDRGGGMNRLLTVGMTKTSSFRKVKPEPGGPVVQLREKKKNASRSKNGKPSTVSASDRLLI